MTEQQIIETLATKVMGWKRYGDTNFWHGDNGNWFDYSLWNPLKNIADAWMLVEKLREKCIFIDIHPTADSYNVSYDFGREVVNAPTASEAISMAAYKLVA